MHEVLIPLLAFLAVVALGSAWVAVRVVRREPLLRRLEPTEAMPSGLEPDSAPRRTGWLRRALYRIGLRVSGPGPTAGLKDELAQAGYHDRDAVFIYLGSKALLFITGLAGFAFLLLPVNVPVTTKVLAGVAGAGLLSFVPNVLVRIRRARRTAEVRRHLPDALDLMEICVTSGMGMDTAWNSVADEVRGVSPLFADEMVLTNLQMHLGATRSVAMRRMASRTGVDELASFVGVLVQSERFGTSIAEAVQTFAQSMRDERSERAQEAAEKMAVKLLFPMVLFIFPTLFVVIVGPAGIQLAQLFSGQ